MKHQPHERVVSGVFDSREEVHKALDALAATDIPTEEISVIMNERAFEEEEFSEITTGLKLHDESVHSAKLGGAVGAVLAAATALVGMITAGAGLLAAGPIIAVIASCGGLLGALIGAGFKENEADAIDDAVRQGKILLAVHSEDHGKARRAEEILRECHAQMVHHY
jgi:hypothetical protein